MIKRLYSLLLLIVFLMLVLPVVLTVDAQDATAPLLDPSGALRDPLALAERYLGFSGAAPIPPLTPIYKVGDTAEFWVGKAGSIAPVRVQARLAAVTPYLYLWTEAGVNSSGDLTQAAGQLTQIFISLLQHDSYRQPVIDPNIGRLTDPNDLIPTPDVDNDPHLYILFTSHLSTDREAVINPLDSLPVAFAPYSNQHEMLYIDTEPYAGTTLGDPLYQTILARGIYAWIMSYNAPQQADWLTETLSWALLYNLQQAAVSDVSLTTFLQTPDYPLFQPSTLTAQSQALGGQQLFLAYVIQRVGIIPVIDLFLQQGNGVSPLDAVLAKNDITDRVTGEVITGRDVFADFAMTNALDIGFGDGRYMQTAQALPQGQTATATALVPDQPIDNLSVSQFGTQYFRYTATDAQTVNLNFSGTATVPRLPMPADRDSADPFYWSGRAEDANPTLTRAIDLSGAEKATLTFDAWYDFAPGWDYGYVSASSDDGATWTTLHSTSSNAANQYGLQYGAGFTGISNAAGPHPFPTLGMIISGDGITVADLVAGGAAEQAGALRGDVIIGYDNQEWTTAPNVIGLLGNYVPGDTLHLYIQRGQDKLDLPVVLGAHPTRVVEPEPLWLAQTVDLSAYAGQKILLRFEAVTLPGHEDQGFAVDNLAIPEIDWTDSADAIDADWTNVGWESVGNEVPQRWIVQAATGGSQTTFPRVQHLITPDSTDAPTVEQKFSLVAGEALIVAVSGANDDTNQRPSFSVGLTQESLQ